MDKTSKWHYWMSIASVKGNNEPDLHWPKFYVKDGKSRGQLSDGGTNPSSKPQPMFILLLRVDDATNQRFERWHEQGKTEGWQGLPVKQAEIVARVPIKFP